MNLTPAERQIGIMLACGWTPQEIADRFNRSYWSVATQITHIADSAGIPRGDWRVMQKRATILGDMIWEGLKTND